MKRERLSDQVREAVGTARLTFGPERPSIPAARCLEAGQPHFSERAPGATVGALLTNDQPSVELLLGAIEAGARLVSLPLPSRPVDPIAYGSLVRKACESQVVQEVVARDDLASLLSTLGIVVRPHSDLHRAPLAGPTGSGFELVQFSSGSTAQPKAVRLDDERLGANIASILRAVEPGPGDCSVSWLPLSHDMGLVGMLLASLVAASPSIAGSYEIVLLDPAQFLRRPQIWATALTERSGSVTAAPDFGYRLCLERSGRSSFDLSRLRCAIVGGETIRSSTLHDFSRRFASAGFRRASFAPAYGLAEVGLAVSMTPMESAWQEMAVATGPLADRDLVSRNASAGEAHSTLVSSGPPLSGYELCSTEGPGQLGRIRIRGPSIGVDAITGASFADADGWFTTGDIGAIVDGWLYVAGRGDDYVVTNGRNIYAPAVEDAVSRVPGVRAGRTAVLGLPSGDWVVASEPLPERARAGRTNPLRREIRTAVVRATGCAPSEVILIRRGDLPITPSGKLRRREAVRRYLAGDFSA